MVTINRYIKALLRPAGGHQGSHKAHQAGNQRISEWLYIYTILLAYNCNLFIIVRLFCSVLVGMAYRRCGVTYTLRFR